MVSVPRLTSTRLRSPCARESRTVAADSASTESEPFRCAVSSAFCALTRPTIPHTDTAATATVATHHRDVEDPPADPRHVPLRQQKQDQRDGARDHERDQRRRRGPRVVVLVQAFGLGPVEMVGRRKQLDVISDAAWRSRRRRSGTRGGCWPAPSRSARCRSEAGWRSCRAARRVRRRPRLARQCGQRVLRRRPGRSGTEFRFAAVSTPPDSSPVATVAFASDSDVYRFLAWTRSGSVWRPGGLGRALARLLGAGGDRAEAHGADDDQDRDQHEPARRGRQPVADPRRARRPRGRPDGDACPPVRPRSRDLRASCPHPPPTWRDFHPRAMRVVITLVSSSTPRPGAGPVSCSSVAAPALARRPTPNLVVAAGAI